MSDAPKIAEKMKTSLVKAFADRGMVACTRTVIPGAESAGPVLLPIEGAFEQLAEDFSNQWASAFNTAIREFGENKVWIDRKHVAPKAKG